jgi:hypothetical protein
MLRLSTQNKLLKVPKEYSFLDSQGGGMSLLKYFLIYPMTSPTNINEINTFFFSQPFKEFAYIFA